MSKGDAKPAADRKELRTFGVGMGCMLALFFGLLIPWVWDLAYPVWPWPIALAFALLGLALPVALTPILPLWMKVAQGLGWINTRLIISMMFFGLVVPVGLLMRLLRADPMARKLDSKQMSYRVTSVQARRESMERPF